VSCACADDNELCQRLVNPLRQGVRLHAVIDACHSGSALDLPFRCKVRCLPCSDPACASQHPIRRLTEVPQAERCGRNAVSVRWVLR
jgi:hypothetical protein